jgi:hypothetical protein
MNKLHLDELSGLPGEEIIRPGLIDFEQKKSHWKPCLLP